MNKHGDRVVDEAVMSAAGDAALCVVVCVGTSVRCRMTRRWVSRAIVCVYGILAIVSDVSAGRSVAEECEGVYRIWPWPTAFLGAHVCSPNCSIPWHGMVLLYCIASSHCRRLSACLVHAHAAVLRSSCRRPMQLQMHCASFGRSKHPPERTAPVQRRGPANTGGAAPGPPAPQRIWMHLDIELDMECRAAASDEPARAWPPGATWLYWLARASSLSRPRLPPVSPSRRTSGPIQCRPPAEQRGSHCCQARRRLITTAQRAPSRLVASRSLPSPLPFPST
jgi:hypothetical protein